MAAAWASAQDVITVTGVTASEQQLAQAQAAIEVFTNRMFLDTVRMRTRDVYWLGRAVAYQAAWIVGQFGLETRLDATQIQQDGVSTTLKGDGLTLAPMAAKALQRVSWMKGRTIHVRSPLEGVGPIGNILFEGADEQQWWTPIDMGDR